MKIGISVDIRDAARQYNLSIIASDIQDVKPNVTMFIVVENIKE